MKLIARSKLKWEMRLCQ